MKQTIYYCDYCKKQITKRNEIKTPIIQQMFIGSISAESYRLGGECCHECYKSYIDWTKTRRNKK